MSIDLNTACTNSHLEYVSVHCALYNTHKAQIYLYNTNCVICRITQTALISEGCYEPSIGVYYQSAGLVAVALAIAEASRTPYLIITHYLL